MVGSISPTRFGAGAKLRRRGIKEVLQNRPSCRFDGRWWLSLSSLWLQARLILSKARESSGPCRMIGRGRLLGVTEASLARVVSKQAAGVEH